VNMDRHVPAETLKSVPPLDPRAAFWSLVRPDGQLSGTEMNVAQWPLCTGPSYEQFGCG
jgi:hypothetical protein